MSKRIIIVTLLALTSGMSAAVGVYQLSKGSTESTVKLETLVVAAVDIPAGVTVDKNVLTTIEMPAAYVPNGVIQDLESVVGRTTRQRLLAGELVLEAKIASEGEGVGLAPLIKPGMRAFTILTPTMASGVAGFILPGNRVDVLFTMADNGKTADSGGAITTPLLQRIEVIAVNQQMEVPEEHLTKKMQSVTLMVTPQQAAELSIAQHRGTLNLLLRNDGDDSDLETFRVTLNDIRFRNGLIPVPQTDEEMPKFVVIAANHVQAGEVFKADALTTRELSEGEAQEGMIQHMVSILGRRTKVPLIKGDIIVKGQVAAMGEAIGLAPLVTPGMRAFTILTPTMASGVAGFILPGNRVDVLLTTTENSTDRDDVKAAAASMLLLQNITVIAVDQLIDVPAEHRVDELRSVTLMVTPQQSAELSISQERGKLYLALRNDSDAENSEIRRVSFDQIQRRNQPSLVQEKRAEREQTVTQTIRTLRGGQLGSVFVRVFPETKEGDTGHDNQ